MILNHPEMKPLLHLKHHSPQLSQTGQTQALPVKRDLENELVPMASHQAWNLWKYVLSPCTYDLYDKQALLADLTSTHMPTQAW
jgi:hypothetical protein